MAFKWFKNNFCEGMNYDELNALAAAVPPGSSGLTFLPYLCGSTMPKYNPEARGVFSGLTLEHTRGHFVRAIFEAVACMLKSNLDYLGLSCTEIRSMGGGASSPLWCQIKADLCRRKLTTLQNEETACLGSAILAGVAVGLFDSVDAALDHRVTPKHTYLPTDTDYSDCYRRFLELESKNV
jgi:xylulokinase